MGRGEAQLGKAVKGKNQEPKDKDSARDKAKNIRDAAANNQLSDEMLRQAELERLAKQAEVQLQRLKALQQQEAENTQLNRMRLLNMQRVFMRSAKTESLRLEAEILAQNHQREVDRKDALVRMLAKDLEEMEEQFQKAQRTHMDRSGQLVTVHNMRLQQLEDEFERDLRILKDEMGSERDRMQAQHARDVKELKGVIDAVETEERKRSEEAKQAHETEREEIRNKNLEDINMLRINLENKIEDLAKQFDNAHQQYVDHTDQANKQFKKLVKKDRVLNKQIEAHKHKIEKFQGQLASWRKTTAQAERECLARNEALRAQKESITQHCQELKARTKRFRTNEAKRLTELTLLSRDALKRNQERLDQAERVILLAELCRKYETEKEKVLPFDVVDNGASEAKTEAKTTGPLSPRSPTTKAASPSDADVPAGTALTETGTSNPALAAALESLGLGDLSRYGQLERFFQRYNKALLEQLAVEEERLRLEQENQDLKSLLKQYLDGVAVTPNVMDKANPLLIVNGRVDLLPTKETPVRRGPPGGVVEAAITVRAYAAHQRSFQ